MTREEAIKVIKNNWPDGRYMLKEALTMAIEALNPWHSVADGDLPKCDIIFKDKNYPDDNELGIYNACFHKWDFPEDDDSYTQEQIREFYAYYMPIPELPKVEQ